MDYSIFKKYDIRGIYPNQINEDLSYKIGKGFAVFLLNRNVNVKKIVVSSDMRLSSPSLKKEVIRGITEMGLDVIDIEMASTPTFYFAVAFYNFDGGIQVSASHNPKEYNGFKLVKEKSVPISENSGILEIKDIIANNRFANGRQKGSIVKKGNVLKDLADEQLKNADISKIKKFKIVADAANSMGGRDIEEFFKRVPSELIKLNFKLDGSFPSHQADPLKEENLLLLKKSVVENKADFGIASDGDGDRYFFVDELGNVMRQEILRGIMAQIELEENPGAAICYDIRPGRITKDIIDEFGGKPVITPVGHSLIKEIMIKNDIIFGGESSGHYFYKKKYGTFEMPMILLFKFLKFISEKNVHLSEIIKKYSRYFNSGEINIKVENAEDKLKEIEKIYKNGKINKLDGITVEYPNWWFNVRSSNTEPVVRLNIEAVSKKLMEEKTIEVSSFLRKK